MEGWWWLLLLGFFVLCWIFWYPRVRLGIRETTQMLRALALLKDLGSISSPYIDAYNLTGRGELIPPLASEGPKHAYSVPRHLCRENTCTHKMKLKFKNSNSKKQKKVYCLAGDLLPSQQVTACSPRWTEFSPQHSTGWWKESTPISCLLTSTWMHPSK